MITLSCMGVQLHRISLGAVAGDPYVYLCRVGVSTFLCRQRGCLYMNITIQGAKGRNEIDEPQYRRDRALNSEDARRPVE